MTTYGYLRSGQENPNFKRYMNALSEANCDEIFIDQFSKNSKYTPQLDKLLDTIKPGDKIFSCDLVSVSRDIQVMARVLNAVKAKNAHFETLNDVSDFASPEGVLGPFIKRLAIDYLTLSAFKAAKELERTD